MGQKVEGPTPFFPRTDATKGSASDLSPDLLHPSRDRPQAGVSEWPGAGERKAGEPEEAGRRERNQRPGSWLATPAWALPRAGSAPRWRQHVCAGPPRRHRGAWFFGGAPQAPVGGKLGRGQGPRCTAPLLGPRKLRACGPRPRFRGRGSPHSGHVPAPLAHSPSCTDSYIRQERGKVPPQSSFGLARDPQLRTNNYIKCDKLRWRLGFVTCPAPAAHAQPSWLSLPSVRGGKTNTREAVHALGSCSALRVEARGDHGRAGRGEGPAWRQRGFRHKVPSPTPMSLAEPRPRVPAKVHQIVHGLPDRPRSVLAAGAWVWGTRRKQMPRFFWQPPELRSSGLCQAGL